MMIRKCPSAQKMHLLDTLQRLTGVKTVIHRAWRP
jgi:hypothetical protein